MADGTYHIEGILKQAKLNQKSMADSAVAKPLSVIKEGENLFLELELLPVSAGVLSGYLYQINYFPDEQDAGVVPGPGASAGEPEVVSYYEDTYDYYNDPVTGADDQARGNLYPHTVRIPIEMEQEMVWLKLYIPLMEDISRGSGNQYVRLFLDWSVFAKDGSTVSPSEEPGAVETTPSEEPGAAETTPSGEQGAAEATPSEEPGAATTPPDHLADGYYLVSGKMTRLDQTTLSMSDVALGHTLMLQVTGGQYFLTAELGSVTVGSREGYLSDIKYYQSGYRFTEDGGISGDVQNVSVKEYQTDGAGNRLKDSFGTDYPKRITFPVIAEAQESGLIPLQLFIPVMEQISSGMGTQAAFLRLDWSTLKAVTESSAVQAMEQSGRQEKNGDVRVGADDKTAAGNTQNAGNKKKTTAKTTEEQNKKNIRGGKNKTKKQQSVTENNDKTTMRQTSETANEESDVFRYGRATEKGASADSEEKKVDTSQYRDETESDVEIMQQKNNIDSTMAADKKIGKIKHSSKGVPQYPVAVVVSALSVVLGIIYKCKSRMK